MNTIIKPNHEYLVYRGRYDNSDQEAPVFGFPYSGIIITFEGTEISISLRNLHVEKENYLGVLVDNKQESFLLGNEDGIQTITIASGLEDRKHEVFVFKRMDLCHQIMILSFDLGERGKILMPRKQPRKLFEFYGDTSMIRTVEEENAYYSAAAIVGRLQHARVSLIAHEGVALKDGLGKCEVGMETLFSKASFNLKTLEGGEWNFQKEKPNVVFVSLGQFDQYPENFMKEDYNGQKSKEWKETMIEFVTKLRNYYPGTLIVLMTSICRHSPKWDRAIGQICANFHEKNVVHFLYNENGRLAKEIVTNAQSEKMALELNSLLLGLENTAWN
ncbi:MAG: hypothetical protein Q4F05_16885 [bacterium]|nr:hypothetical protein [bacterium]